ncbi:MAG TPA: leishmanolysin-related zinc metalloendopeptidase [Gemmatimonadaceae bacterium]
MSSALVMTDCRDGPTSSRAAFVVEASLSLPPTATVGGTLAQPPTFVVRDASGQALANAPVTVAVTGGNGTLRDPPSRTGTGPTPVGDWTLDTLAGVNVLTILAGSAPAVTIEILGIPDAPATIRVNGAGQQGFAGEFLDEPLSVDVVDRYGNSIPDVQVDLAIVEGGGDVAPASVRTQGSAGGADIAWRLGRRGGAQRIIASGAGLSATIGAQIRSDFLPIVRFHGTIPSAEVQGAFALAAERVHAIVTGDVSDVPVFNFDMSRCGLTGPILSEVVDDLVIYAVVTPMDGVGKVLASAGPCVVRTQSRLPVVGVMRFDSDDIAGLSASGSLPEVILHEMLHILGLGPGWHSRGQLTGSGTSDPRFTGPQTGLHCIAAGGAAFCSDRTVPLENLGGSGTAEVHWREAVFDGELMTGFVETVGDMPLSAMSVASLEDLGFTVNLFASDPYRVPEASHVAPRLSPLLAPPWESILTPLFEVTATGWVRPLPRVKPEKGELEH